MNRRVLQLVAAALTSAAVFATLGQVKISAVYGGGSSTSTTFLSEFRYDFVELRNNSLSPVTLTGHSLQYRGGTGTTFTGKINLPEITIPASGFFLIRTEPGQSGTCGAGAPCRSIGTPDFIAVTGTGGTGQIQLSATNGVLALVNSQTLLTGACPLGNVAILDLVGYGAPATSTTCYEGSGPTGTMGNQFASVRRLNGCQDTNNNAADFEILSSTFSPRNTTSQPVGCTGGCIADCDNNFICDEDEINAQGGTGGVGGSLDQNSNGQLDLCEIPCEIVSQPTNQLLLPGETAHLTVDFPRPNSVFEWQRNSVAVADGPRISGASTNHLSISPVQSSDQGTYRCLIANACGNFTTQEVQLSCRAIVDTQPVGGDFIAGALIVLSANVRTAGPTIYRWTKDGANLNNNAVYSGVTTPTLTISSNDPAQSGTYVLNVTNSCGVTSTTPAPVVVTFLECDSIDFNNDGSFFDPQDIDALLSVFGEGPCIPQLATCNDIDFNNDTSVFDPCDIDSYLAVFGEGPCTLCGV